MRLRDMLAAAVRPWVRVNVGETMVQVDVGEYGVFGPRFSLRIGDRGLWRVDGIYLGSRQRIGGGCFGDLVVQWSSSKMKRRKHEEWRAKYAANDSKAAA